MAANKKKKQLKSAMKSTTFYQQKKASFEDNKNAASKDMTMVASYNTTISQLMEQVLLIKMENKQILDWFDWLASQMEAFMNHQPQLLEPVAWWVKGLTVRSQPGQV